MELLDCIEDDIKLWLSLDKTNTVNCSTTTGTKEFTTFEKFRMYYDNVIRICYKREGIEIMAIYRRNNDITKIYFNEIIQINYNFIPWIDMIQSTEPMFGYYRSGIPKDRPMGQIKNVRELYSVAKIISISVIDDCHNEIISYYDSLPLFKAFSYMLGDLDGLPNKEITIEI